MTRYAQPPAVHHATVRAYTHIGNGAYSKPRTVRPFVHDRGKCAVCGIERERVNGVCLVCRANFDGVDFDADENDTE